MLKVYNNKKRMKKYKFFCRKEGKCDFSFVSRSNRCKKGRYAKICHSSNECNFKTTFIVRVKEERI
jgi:hypothetical protein